jgi:hypothetical protein
MKVETYLESGVRARRRRLRSTVETEPNARGDHVLSPNVRCQVGTRTCSCFSHSGGGIDAARLTDLRRRLFVFAREEGPAAWRMLFGICMRVTDSSQDSCIDWAEPGNDLSAMPQKVEKRAGLAVV